MSLTYGQRERPSFSVTSMFGGKEIGNDFKVKPGVVSATRTVPDHISKPEYAYSGEPGESDPFAIRVYNKEEQEKAHQVNRRTIFKILRFDYVPKTEETEN